MDLGSYHLKKVFSKNILSKYRRGKYKLNTNESHHTCQVNDLLHRPTRLLLHLPRPPYSSHVLIPPSSFPIIPICVLSTRYCTQYYMQYIHLIAFLVVIFIYLSR
jgi:hypothetical protein